MRLSEREGQLALDGFCGTGNVSYLFKNHGINTISNDFLKFSCNRTRAILLNNNPPKLESLETTKHNGFIYNNYSETSGVRVFKDNISQHIDGCNIELSNLKSSLSEDEFSYYKAQVVEAADFRSNIMGSYESFYKSGWRKQCLKQWRLEEFKLIQGTTQHIVYNKNIIDLLSSDLPHLDFIYLDPPYNSRQYSSLFHVLETIALDDSPVTSGVNNKRRLYKKSNFSSKRNAEKNFENLSSLCAKRTDEVFLSYSTDGIVSFDKLKQTFLKNFKNVTLHLLPYRRFKTNKNTRKDKLKEIILHASK